MHPERECCHQPDLGKEGKSSQGPVPSPQASSLSLAASLKYITSICFKSGRSYPINTRGQMCPGGVATVGWAGRGQEGHAQLLFVLAVARAVPRGTSQVLRTGSQGTAAPHAALPRLVCQGQLRECLDPHPGAWPRMAWGAAWCSPNTCSWQCHSWQHKSHRNSHSGSILSTLLAYCLSKG